MYRRSNRTKRFLFALLFSAACGADSPGPTLRDGGAEGGAAPQGLAQFKPAACWFPKVSGRRVDCGFIPVPEAHDPIPGNRRTIDLAVAIFRSSAASPAPDPLVYIAGGPGASGVAEVAGSLGSGSSSVFGKVLGSRDVIALDQRGTGASQPSLACTPQDAKMVGGTENVPGSLRACHDRLVRQGIDLSRYNTAEIAADVEDVRKALGHSQWNVMGSSYGTRIALEYARQYGAVIRAMVLDSVVPPQVDAIAEDGPNLWDAFLRVSSACAAQPACARAYPRLPDELRAQVARLDQKPTEFTVESSSRKLDGRELRV